MKVWKGQLPEHTIAIKLDGIQAMLKGDIVVSRSGKKLYNIDPKLLEPGKKYEVFLGSFKKTNSVVRSHDHETKIKRLHLFEIYPNTDVRLQLPLDSNVEGMFKWALSVGHEGLVIDQKYKLKNTLTYDVKITDILPGKGKHLGRMGALMTTKGKVGTGFTDKEREEQWKVGELIEVECMELTEDGKFRHPRFIRRRWDK